MLGSTTLSKKLYPFRDPVKGKLKTSELINDLNKEVNNISMKD